jgi:hypothetical protein
MKWYVGSRTRKNCHPIDGYICSSKRVKPMILENPSDWRREILATGTQEDMIFLETEILNLFDAKNDVRSFNAHNGDGKFTMLHRGGYKRPGIGGVKKGSTPWNKGLSKDMDSRVMSYVNNQPKNKVIKKVRADNGRVKTLNDNLPWKGQYISPRNEIFLTTVAASKKYDVHRMTIYRWATSGKNGWKFIPKELVVSESNGTNFKGEI